MKATYNWLKDFVDIKISPDALADKLTMAGLEVGALEERGGDFVFEIEITSNRPDWLCVMGIAREVAAITGKKLKNTPIRSIRTLSPAPCPLKLSIENKKDCPLYTAKIIRDVKVGPSPDWLSSRLELVGCRSVNNIVDITNYILFTYGEPLHAFDLDKLNSQQPEVRVRRAKDQEKLVAINGQEKILDPEILVIADQDKAIAIAGLMGGKDTEVTLATRNILLEAAVFNSITIRRGRQKLGLQSESSYRFERGVDLGIVEDASLRAVALIQEFASGKCVAQMHSSSPKTHKKSIPLSSAFVEQILGVNIPAVKISKYLTSLGFKLAAKGKTSFLVHVPSHRPDVNLEIDLIEEIARLYGYAAIPQDVPRHSYRAEDVAGNKERDAILLIKNMLVGLGLNEVITYSMVDKEGLRDLLPEPAPALIEILNPLSQEQEVLRPTLMGGILRCVAVNLNQKQEYVNIFEIAKVYSQGDANIKEEWSLAIALCGVKSLLLSAGLVKEEAGLLHLKGVLEVCFTRLGIKDYKFTLANPAEVSVLVNKDKIGTLRRIPAGALARYDIKNKEAFGLEINLAKVFPSVDVKKKFTPLPIYPAVSRDISLVFKEAISIDDILEAVKAKAGVLLREARVSDYYKGKQIPAGYKGVTISCLYRSDEGTLTEAQISPLHSLITGYLSDKFQARIRA